MKHQRPTSALSRCLLAFCLIFCVEQAAAQTIGRQKVDQFPINPWGTKNYGLTWLPADYHSTNDKYPLIIFLHGAGEAGSGAGALWGLLSQALPQKIAQGWDPQAVNPQDGKTYKFIVVSPQAAQWSHNYSSLPYILEDILDRYRVDKNRIYVTGLSAGGAGTWSAVTNGQDFAKKFAAIVPVSAAGTNTPQEATQLPLIGGSYGVKTWTICGTGDTFWSLATSFANIINSGNPEEKVEATGIAGEGHTPGAWNTAYDPNWRSNVHGKNIYEWMLKSKRNGNSGGNGNGGGGNNNQLPTASAGSNQTITLPNNSIQLNGTGNDPDGFIANYSWTKVSGPSANIINPTSANTIVNNLNAGTYTFKLTVTDNRNATATDQITITVNPAPVVPVYKAVPAKIEAENYDDMSGVQVENTNDNGSAKNVGYINMTDWMEYNINPAASGNYTLQFRVATPENGAQFHVRKADGTTLASVSVPKTGGWNKYQTVSANVQLNAGNQVLRIVSVNADSWNFNWMEFTQSTPPPPPPAAASLRFEAENWNRMSGVQTENTADVGGGLNVGWIDNGDWMEYNVNAPSAGTYTLKLRIATPQNNAEMEIRRNGSEVKTIDLPKTGAYQNWMTVTTTLNLTAGQQTIRLVSSRSGAWNINWLQFVLGTANPNSDRIEAENWASMSGVQTENTSDVDGGLNVGWIDNADWMKYEVTVPQSGTYKMKFRIATTNSNAQFLVKAANGNTLKTVNVPKTNGYQIWKTISEDIYLQQGTQSIKLESTGGGAWNINWLEVKSDDSNVEEGSSIVTAAAGEEAVVEARAPLSIFPNPVNERLAINVSNDLTGSMTVQVVNMAGAVKKQFNLTKGATGTTQSYLLLNELAPGAYLIRVQMNEWIQTMKIIKN